MDTRIIEFIAALRTSGVRVSVAESADALRAIAAAGIDMREFFRAALQASLIKEARDIEVFQRLFPLYFGSSGGALVQPGDDGSLADADQQFLERMLREVMNGAPQPHLAQIFEALIAGRPMTQAALLALIEQTSPLGVNHPYFQPWMARRVMRELQFEHLEMMLRELLALLRGGGMAEEKLREIEQTARSNQEALVEQMGRLVGQQMMRQAAAERPQMRPLEELIDRPFEVLSHDERHAMRDAVTKLAARLRARAALRQRRGKRGTLDAKGTIRANMQFGGVPLRIKHRRRHLKPKLVVLCDLSNSMRATASFMLLLVYALQDQFTRTRSFAFIDELTDISMEFANARPLKAIERIMARVRADYAHTDLGYSLRSFVREHMNCIDHRTSVIILGDGRNNYNDPGLEALATVKARARHLIWFNPESRRAWHFGDSDMARYEPLCDAVHHVANMRQLTEAIDALFMRY